MEKVIILKTGETASELDIRIMRSIDLVNYLSKAKRLLEGQEGKEAQVKMLEGMINNACGKAA